MATIQNKILSPRYEEMLRELSLQKVSELEQFAQKLRQLIDHKKSPNYQEEEQKILNKIRTSSPSVEFWAHYNQLADKSDANELTEEEKELYSASIKVIHKWDFERLQLVTELAKLWNISVSEANDRVKIKVKTSTYGK